MNKKAQEEMVGFALIIIIVAIIILVFISFSINSDDSSTVESYEAQSFVQSALQYTSECEDYSGLISVRDLIFKCAYNSDCLDGENSCSVLNSTINDILKDSWKVDENSPIKGYEMKIDSEEGEILLIVDGNKTSNSKGTYQDYSRSGNLIGISFSVYY